MPKVTLCPSNQWLADLLKAGIDRAAADEHKRLADNGTIIDYAMVRKWVADTWFDMMLPAGTA